MSAGLQYDPRSHYNCDPRNRIAPPPKKKGPGVSNYIVEKHVLRIICTSCLLNMRRRCRKPTSAVEDDVEASLKVCEVVPQSVEVETVLDVASVHLAQHAAQ